MTEKIKITNPDDFSVFIDSKGNQVNDITETSKQVGYCIIPKMRESFTSVFVKSDHTFLTAMDKYNNCYEIPVPRDSK